MACSSTKKKSSSIVQRSIGILTVILVVLIVAMMMIVSSIQGTARIVNYAGLVRGKTQRIVKFEISGEYSRAAEPPVQCGVSHLSRRTEPHCL